MAAETTTVRQATCPECEGQTPLQRRPVAGEIIVCAGCGAELEVRSAEPLTVALAPEVEEDWGE